MKQRRFGTTSLDPEGPRRQLHLEERFFAVRDVSAPTQRIMAYAAAGLIASASAAALASAALLDEPSVNRVGLVTIALNGFMWSIALASLQRWAAELLHRITLPVVATILIGGSAFVSVGVACSGPYGQSSALVYFAFPIFAFYLFRPRAASLMLLLVAIELGFVLSVSDGIRLPGLQWLYYMSIILWVGGLVGWLMHRADLLVESEHRAHEAAQAAAEAKSVFLATMSHEIRTPLNAIIGMTYLLEDTPLTDDQHSYVHTVRTSGEALLAIINDVLDFSKIEADRLDLEEEPFDIRETIEDVVDVVAPSAAAKEIELTSFVDDDVPRGLVGDTNRLRQVLLNLLNNAVKFTTEGEVALSISTEAHGPDAVRLHAVVRDTGIGIRPDRIDALFESFTQLDASTTRRFGGTGLGLAISRRLTELMGGTLSAESDGPGRGATFRLEVPFAVVDLPPRYDGEEVALLRDRRVLVVDDNATNRHLLHMQGQAWGMQVRETERPADALAWIDRGDPFDLAILDMQMPDMDGLELAGALQARRGHEFPIVIMSSMGRGGQAAAEHRVRWLNKPVKPSQLFNTVVGLLEERFGVIERITSADSAETIGGPAAFDSAMAARHPLRILLAEDNMLNQQVALKVLARLGYEASLANDGLEAVAAIARQNFDVVFLDVQMPGMDGLEVARHVCNTKPPGERPHLVAMTANAMAGDRAACLDAGMDDYLAKPIRLDELVSALERAHRRPTPTTVRPTSDDNVVDIRTSLRRVVGNDDGAIVEIVDLFLAEGVPLLDRLVRDRWARDTEGFTRAAHTLKSNASSLGAAKLAATCRQLEAGGRSGQTDGLDALIERARTELAELVIDLRQLRKELT